MRLFNTIATIGALCAVCDAIPIPDKVNQEKLTPQTEITLAKLDKIDNLTARMKVLKNLNITGLSAAGHAMGKKQLKMNSKFYTEFEATLVRQGGGNWWSWLWYWPSAIYYSTADLYHEVTSDALNWIQEAHQSFQELTGQVMGDVIQILSEAQQDLAEWEDHLQQGDIGDIADDVIGWVDDLRSHLQDWVTSATEEGLELVDIVADDVIGWVGDIADDLESIIDGTYCFENDANCELATQEDLHFQALNATLP